MKLQSVIYLVDSTKQTAFLWCSCNFFCFKNEYLDVCIYAHGYLFALLLRPLAFSKWRRFCREIKKKKSK